MGGNELISGEFREFLLTGIFRILWLVGSPSLSLSLSPRLQHDSDRANCQLTVLVKEKTDRNEIAENAEQGPVREVKGQRDDCTTNGKSNCHFASKYTFIKAQYCT